MWEPRDGLCRVTGVFRFSRGELYNLFVEGEAGPIPVTAEHPFWSGDRHDWVAACELMAGERLLTDAGTRLVLGWEPRGDEPVFNLEVDSDHCYRVGQQGVLVHNASAKLQDFLQATDAKRTKDYVEPGAAKRKASGENTPLFKGYRNLGALYYKLGKDSTTLIRLPASDFVEGSGGKANHAERKLLMMLPSKGCPAIVELYTERYPCKTCDPILEEFAMMMNSDTDILVYFIAPAGDGTDSKSSQDLLDAYDKTFHLRWW